MTEQLSECLQGATKTVDLEFKFFLSKHPYLWWFKQI